MQYGLQNVPLELFEEIVDGTVVKPSNRDMHIREASTCFQYGAKTTLGVVARGYNF